MHATTTHALDVMHQQRLHKEDQRSSELSWGLWSEEKEEIILILIEKKKPLIFILRKKILLKETKILQDILL
jgi:hypothetical protein